MKLQDLAMSLNDWFKCIDGPPRAWFDMQGGRILVDEMPMQGIELTRHIYQTVALAATTYDAEDRILRETWRRFKNLREDVGSRATLVWRAHPEMNCEDEQILGGLWATREDWVDRGQPPVPANVVSPVDSPNFFFLEGLQKVTYFYCRLAIVPAPDYTVLRPKQQGGLVERM